MVLMFLVFQLSPNTSQTEDTDVEMKQAEDEQQKMSSSSLKQNPTPKHSTKINLRDLKYGGNFQSIVRKCF